MGFGAQGCLSLKASPVKTSTVLTNQIPSTDLQARSPFHFNWGKRAVEARKVFDSVFFAPVDISRVNTSETEELGFKVTSANEEDVQEIAKYLHSEFSSALKNRNDPDIKVVTAVGEKTLVVELILVELQPTAAMVNLAGTLGGVAVDGLGLTGWLVQKGSIAIALRARNASGELLGEAADRERDPLTVFNVQNYTEYGHARRTISSWAEQFAELVCTPVENKVEDTSAFRWWPW